MEKPEICPVCNSKVETYSSARTLCTSLTCNYEWFENPPKILPERIHESNVQELLKPGLTNTRIACLMLGWQEGTVHQIARKLGVTVEMILEAKSIIQLIFSVAK